VKVINVSNVMNLLCGKSVEEFINSNLVHILEVAKDVIRNLLQKFLINAKLMTLYFVRNV